MIGPVYQFGDFLLDAHVLELLQGGVPVRLERKPLELLLLLVCNQGRPVSRAEIAAQLWGDDVFVDTEHGINTAIRKIRAVLSDDPGAPCFLRTVPRLGYCFFAPVTLVTPQASQSEEVTTSALPSPPSVTAATNHARVIPVLFLAGFLFTAITITILSWLHSRAALPKIRYEQLTDLTDAAVAPTISPDGRSLAFLRGTDFFSDGPIYVESLLNGSIRQASSDVRSKYGPAFSPDGTQIAYSVFDPHGLNTYVVPASGGTPHLFMKNAAGLTWPDRDHLLFSRITSGVHLGVVEESLGDANTKQLYFPAALRGMAHYSFLSPDRRSMIVVEMDGTGAWAPCRLVSLADNHSTQSVGPKGPCTAAAWAPNGRWMYFVALIDGQNHIWRQEFPTGGPQQLTYGAAEESGLAIDGSGALLTSIGDDGDVLYFHDNRGDMTLSSEGKVQSYPAEPLFRQSDAVLYYLLWRNTGKPGAELWQSFPQTGANAAVFPGIQMLDFDVSRDNKEVVYTSLSPAGKAELWLAPLDHAYPPVRLGIQGAQIPRFGADRQIVFQIAEGNVNYLEQIQRNGSGRSRVTSTPINELQGISPDARVVTATVTESPKHQYPTVFAFPLDGSRPRRLCDGYCVPRWSSDGRFLVFSLESKPNESAGHSVAIPIPAGKTLPDIPAVGLDVLDPSKAIAGTHLLERSDVILGREANHYAYIRHAAHRNIFRLTIN